MATEPADVLIVGAGASGGVVALRLAEAGFKVVCLEQGDWHDKADYRGTELDWELTMRKQWSTSPNVRGLPEDYPLDETDADISPLMFSGVGGSMLIFAGRLAADAALRLPGALPRRHRRRLAPRRTTSCARTTSGPTASSGSRGWAATRPIRPAARTRRCRRCRSAPAG